MQKRHKLSTNVKVRHKLSQYKSKLKEGSVLESKNQDENTNSITIVRNLVDNNLKFIYIWMNSYASSIMETIVVFKWIILSLR